MLKVCLGEKGGFNEKKQAGWKNLMIRLFSPLIFIYELSFHDGNFMTVIFFACDEMLKWVDWNFKPNSICHYYWRNFDAASESDGKWWNDY